MLELPECATMAKQLNDTVRGKTIRKSFANASPHKFAFYSGDPSNYNALLAGRAVGDSAGIGAMVEISVGENRVVLGDGANLRYYADAEQAPAKHQLFIGFHDGSALVCSVQMYGSVFVFPDGECDNPYYHVAREKPQPATEAFDKAYFSALCTDETLKLSAKAFLAAGQRIPGLGNGTLQDILFYAGLHPRRKISTLTGGEYEKLFRAVKEKIVEMTRLGGRDTEKDLYGNPGGYQTVLSKNTVGKPCPVCGSEIKKEAYLGGAVYFCPVCQPLAP